MVASIVIDERGEATCGLPPSIRTGLSARDTLDFMIKNGGYVEIRVFHRGLNIRLRRDIVSPLALTGLLYWLNDSHDTPSVVSYADENWRGRLYRNRDDLTSDIGVWLADGQRSDRWRFIDFHRQILPCDVSAVRSKRHLTIWKDRLREVSDPIELLPQLDFAFSGTHTLYRMHREMGRPVIEAVGSAISQYSHEWAQRAPGRTLREAPDARYGEWVEGHIAGAAGRDIVFDRVTAIVAWAKNRPARVVYDRTIVPIHRSDGSTLLLGIVQSKAS